MRIKKNPEVKRLYCYFAIILLGAIIFSAFLGIFIINKYQTAIYENDAKIVSAVKDYPGAEQNVLKVINGKTEADIDSGVSILNNYGVSKDNVLNAGNELYFYVFVISLPCILALILILIMYSIFLDRQYKRINEITNYSQRVLLKDYSLDIRENIEGDISNLKNEVYKLTVMLKEQAEMQQKDKERLAIALSDISHQLKTPMTSLFVMTDLIKKDDIPYEKKQEFMDTIHNQLDRINWLISSLLTLSKLDAQAIKMKKEKHSIIKLIHAALEPISIPAELKEISINIGKTDASFLGDLYWSREALVNILKNCVEHTGSNGEIDISFEENRLYTELRIKDNGEGISKEDLRNIFKRFYKGKNAAEGSVGIGLAMAQAIIKDQGGDITCNSLLGAGTEFIIKWPKEM